MLNDLCKSRLKLSQILIHKLSEALNPLPPWWRTNRKSDDRIDGIVSCKERLAKQGDERRLSRGPDESFQNQ